LLLIRTEYVVAVAASLLEVLFVWRQYLDRYER